jgi:hypothetical protein
VVDGFRHRPDLKQLFGCRLEKLRPCGAVQPSPKILRLQKERYAVVNTAANSVTALEGLMRKSQIQAGRCYVGKTGFVWCVTDIYQDDAERVESEDGIGSGNCFPISFVSWAQREVEEQHFGKYHLEVP